MIKGAREQRKDPAALPTGCKQMMHPLDEVVDQVREQP
jgi:hypothetical protein